MSFPSSMRNPCRLNSRKRLDIDLIVTSFALFLILADLATRRLPI